MMFIQRKEFQSYPEIEDYKIINNKLYLFSKTNHSIDCIDLSSWKKVFNIQERLSINSFMLVNDYLIISLSNKRKSKIYNSLGDLVLEIQERIIPALSYINGDKILFRHRYLRPNGREMWTELNLNVREYIKWSIINLSTSGRILFNSESDLIFINDIGKEQRTYISRTDKYLVEKWRVYLKNINPTFNKSKFYSSEIYKSNGAIILWMNNDLFSINIDTGEKNWELVNLTDFTHLHFFQDEGYIFAPKGDYLIIDLKRGLIKNSIKNWSNYHYWPIGHVESRWNYLFKIYDNYFTISLGSIKLKGGIYFFDKNTNDLLFRDELNELFRWDRENIELYDNKLFVKISNNSEEHWTLKVYEYAEISPFDNYDILQSKKNSKAATIEIEKPLKDDDSKQLKFNF